MTRVKICGLKSSNDISYVNELKPDYIGFVFAKNSRRYVTKEKAGGLKQLLDPAIKAIGVFVNEPLSDLIAFSSTGVIDGIQLHGQEDENYINELKKHTDLKIIQAFSIQEKQDCETAKKSIADFVLLDYKSGGTGQTFDWTLVSKLDRPYFLAGGLTADNVKEAISFLNPFAVDVSSGVETNGQKDYEKIRKFISMIS